jgi:hypothetical protein
MDETVDSYYNIESKREVTTENYINYRKANHRSAEETGMSNSFIFWLLNFYKEILYLFACEEDN